MKLRDQVLEAVTAGDFDALDKMVAEDQRPIRYLLGLTYRDDPAISENASRGIALAARHHPEHIANLIRRLVWAMNDESGTNALTAPTVLQAIVAEAPELIVPVVPDLVRLSADEGLQEGLAVVLATVVEKCPGTLSRGMAQDLTERYRNGVCNDRRQKP